MSEDEESQVCAKCHDHYSMDAPDMEPTKFCDDCAHDVAEEATAECERLKAELEQAQKTIIQLRASMRLIGNRIKNTKPLADFLNAHKDELTPEIVEAWKEVYSSGIRAQMEAECDAREWYVSKENVKPLVNTLKFVSANLETASYIEVDGDFIGEHGCQELTSKIAGALQHARTLGLLEDK